MAMPAPSPATPHRRCRAYSIPAANCTDDDDDDRALITFNLALNDAEESCHVCRAAAAHALALHPRLLDAASPTLGRGLATPGAGAPAALHRDNHVASTLPTSMSPSDHADADPPACTACETRRWRRAHATLDDTSRRLADWHERVVATDPTGQAGPRKPEHKINRTRSRTVSATNMSVHHRAPSRGTAREADAADQCLPPLDAPAAGVKDSARHLVGAVHMLLEE
ncbi:hypothetical protein GGF32_002785 [Allomyces javanicus]|nr:hypothetical protein GGF32_002785 [Allomyces javanicus]